MGDTATVSDVHLASPLAYPVTVTTPDRLPFCAPVVLIAKTGLNVPQYDPTQFVIVVAEPDSIDGFRTRLLGAGVGAGVDVGAGVGVLVGTGVKVGVAVGTVVGVAVGVGVLVGASVTVGVGVGVFVGAGVAVGVGVGAPLISS